MSKEKVFINDVEVEGAEVQIDVHMNEEENYTMYMTIRSDFFIELDETDLLKTDRFIAQGFKMISMETNTIDGKVVMTFMIVGSFVPDRKHSLKTK